MAAFLGIDTSNYTTSVALVRDGRVVCNIKEPVCVELGKVGVRQSDALFCHTKNLPLVFDRLKPYLIKGEEIAAVGCSAFPRDVEGSYMPCFLSGIGAASAVSAVTGGEMYTFSHQRGHIYAALYSAEQIPLYDGRFVAFHVSGGTTEALLCDGGEISKIGGTLDLTAGQLIDRAGVMMGMAFPCGSHIESCALGAIVKKPKLSVKGSFCNMSGGENKVKDMIKAGASNQEVSGYVLEFVKANLDKMTENILAEYGQLPLLFSGGVMSCRMIKDFMSSKYGAYFAEPAFSSDNACGTALLAERKYLSERSI